MMQRASVSWHQAALLLISFWVGVSTLLAEPVPTTQNPVPFSLNFTLDCADPSQNKPGGYSRVSDITSDIDTLGRTAFLEWFNDTAAAEGLTCTPENILLTRTEVLGACTQVVAGTNYALLVEGFTSCLDNNSTFVVIDAIELATLVYQPLGQAPPEVQFSKVADLHEEVRS